MATVTNITRASNQLKRGKPVFRVVWTWRYRRRLYEAEELVAAEDELGAMALAMRRLAEAKQDDTATPVQLQPHPDFTRLALMEKFR